MDDEDQGGDQLTARQRVIEVFSALSVPQALRRHPADDDMPEPSSGRQRAYRDRRTGKFAPRPEPQRIPADDNVLTLTDAADAAAFSTSKLGATGGRDVTGENLHAPRPAPRPTDETPHVREITFPDQDHGEDCRCHFCHSYERPWWLSRRRRRR